MYFSFIFSISFFGLKTRQIFVIQLLTPVSLDLKCYLVQFKSLKFANLIRTWKSLWLKGSITNSILRAHIDKYICYVFVRAVPLWSLQFAMLPQIYVVLWLFHDSQILCGIFRLLYHFRLPTFSRWPNNL